MTQRPELLRGVVDIRRLQEYNELLVAENAALRARVHLLTRTISAAFSYWPLELPPSLDLVVPKEQPQSWAERSKKFGGIRSLVYTVTRDLIKKEKGPVGYNLIEHSFRQRFPDTTRGTNDLAETVSRRVRELVTDGYLVRVVEGQFFIGSRMPDKELATER